MTLPAVTPGKTPDRGECVEQAYFFRIFRERLAAQIPAQNVLDAAHEEVLATTRLPYAIQFLAAELKHSGTLTSGFARLPHYFTPFQAFVVRQAEDQGQKFTMPAALLVLEREADYKSKGPTPAGLFVYQFEVIARNRLGYDAGLAAVAGDPLFGPEWAAYVDLVRRQAGVIDFADMVYVRSAQYLTDRRRDEPDYEPPVPPLFEDREGRIAAASRGREPLFLFAALQRQLGYPEVPRQTEKSDVNSKMTAQEAKLRDLEARIRMLEAEQRGTFDPTQFGKPDMFRDIPDEE